MLCHFQVWCQLRTLAGLKGLVNLHTTCATHHKSLFETLVRRTCCRYGVSWAPSLGSKDSSTCVTQVEHTA
jgi:hypothetical protein